MTYPGDLISITLYVSLQVNHLTNFTYINSIYPVNSNCSFFFHDKYQTQFTRYRYEEFENGTKFLRLEVAFTYVRMIKMWNRYANLQEFENGSDFLPPEFCTDIVNVVYESLAFGQISLQEEITVPAWYGYCKKSPS